MIKLLLREIALFILLVFPAASSAAEALASVSTYIRDPASQKEFHAYDGSVAIIVGIDGYTQVEPRRSSVAAARSVKDLLMSRYGFAEQNIIFLLDEQARRSVILDGVKKLRVRGLGDRLFVFLSGRGYTEKDESRNERGYFVPFDGAVDSPGQAATSCIALDDLRKAFKRTGAKQTIVLLDFTVGGLPVQNRYSSIPPPRLGFERIVTLPVSELMCAGDRIEQVLDDPATGFSFFASKLIETLSSDLADVNNDGIISGTELAAQTSLKVSLASERKMHPQFGFMDGGTGDYLFILPAPQDTSRILFSYKPVDAVLFIDDKQVKPGEEGIPVVAPRVGTHTFQLQREGYRPIREEFFVNGRVSLTANLILSKIPTRDLLVRVSEPDAKVYVDGKFIGMPDESLLIEGIEKGTHRVRAELEGYFSDSTTVSTEDITQYSVSLKLRSRNGFLTIRSSEGVRIALDGRIAGTREVVRKEVLPGLHRVQLSGIGYDNHEENILVSDTQFVEWIHRMYRPTLGGALVRSAISPGWGQSYSGRRGIFYSGIFALLAAASIDFQLTYTKTNSDYWNNLDQYNKATNATDIATYRNNVQTLNTKRKNENIYRFAAFGLTAAFYVYNIVNVWRNDPADMIREEEAKAKREKKGATVSLEAGEFGPAIKFSVQL